MRTSDATSDTGLILESNEGGLLLSSNAPLYPYQKRQLEYFGAREINGRFLLRDSSPELINRLIRFFETEELPLTLSPDLKQLVANHKEGQNMHLASIQKAQQFKDGEYDSLAYRQHIRFLEQNVKRKLLDHQIKASFHLSLVGNGANFSVPGSGKTTVLLAYYEKLKLQGEVDFLFVVGPPACFGPWRQEFADVLGRNPRTHLFAGGSNKDRRESYKFVDGKSELFLTTFQTLQNDYELVKNMLEQKGRKALLVVDEAHYMKQVNGKWASAVMAIAPSAAYRCVLTGTPIPHSYKDLFNLFAFLWQEQSPLSQEDHIRLEMYEKSKEYDRAAQLLSPKLSPLFYRVRKADLGLQPQFMNEVILQMGRVEKTIYDVVVGNVRDLMTRDYLRQMETIAALRRGRAMRLRQAVSFPKLLISAIDNYDEDILRGDKDIINMIAKYASLEVPSKINKLIELVADYLRNDEKVVIWSNFLGTVELIERTLKETGIHAKKIVGQTPIEREGVEVADTREKIREEFIDPKSGLNVLIANPAACAESISLHKNCHRAIYYDLSFNCAQFLQSLDRIHRVGGSELYPAYYDFLMYEDSIDLKIYENLLGKAERMKALIDQDYSIYSLDMTEPDGDIALEELLD